MGICLNYINTNFRKRRIKLTKPQKMLKTQIGGTEGGGEFLPLCLSTNVMWPQRVNTWVHILTLVPFDVAHIGMHHIKNDKMTIPTCAAQLSYIAS